jgi:putative ABC transport system permease protein
MVLLKLSLQQLRRRPVRTSLTLASIMLAVASIVAVWIGTKSARTAYQDLAAAPGGIAQYEIVAADGQPLDLALSDPVYQLTSLQRVIAVASGQAVVRHQGKRLRTLVSGVDLEQAANSAYWELKSGSWTPPELATRLKPVWLEQELADGLGVKVSDQIILLTTNRGVVRLLVSGTFANKNKLALQEPTVVLTYDDHQAIFEPSKAAAARAERIKIEFPETKDDKPLLAQVKALLPSGWELRKPVQLGEMGDQSLLAVTQGMNFIMALSIGMSAFMILNAFLMNVSERRKQLALFRAIGATRQQIHRVMLVEGLLLGAIGSLLGVPLGIWTASILGESMQRISQLEPRVVPMDWLAVGLASLAGPIVAVVGAYLPARAASKIHPAEGLVANPVDQPDHFPVRYAVIAAILFLVSSIVMVLVIQNQLPQEFSIPSGLTLILAFLYMVPIIIQPLLMVLVKLIGFGGPVEKNLARQQLVRRHTRTVLTVGVLIVAVNSGIGSGNSIITHLNDVQDWYRRSMPGDYFLVSTSGIEDTSELTDPEGTLESDLLKLPALDHADTIHFAKGTVNRLPIIAIVRSLTPGTTIPLDVEPSDAVEVTRQFQAGEVVCSSVLAHRAKLKIGDTVEVELNGQRRPLRIAALTRDYNNGGMTIYVSRQTAAERFLLTDIDVYLATAKAGQVTALGTELTAFAKQHGLVLKSFLEMKSKLDQTLAGIQGAYWLLLVLGFFVAAFGIVNTMTMNILEQTQEIGLLRIIGMTRKQVRGLFLVQAALIGLSSAVMGGVAGVVTAYIMQRSSEPILGYSIPFQLHWPLVLISCALAVVIGIVAAILPIRRATHLELQDALAYE